MNHPRIAHKIYSEPWLLTPSQHASIQRAFESHAAGLPANFAPGIEQEDAPLRIGSVAVVSVFGIIGKHLSMLETACGGCDLNAVSDALSAAMDDPSTEAIVLHFDSPGGTVTGTPEMAERIAEAAKRKPIIAYTEGQCCSAAYWLASQCSAIYASQSSDVGSIGVYLALLDESAAMEKAGVKVNVIKAGKYKTAGAPFKPLSDEERALFQADVDAIYSKFTRAVAANRSHVSSDTMQGQSFSGEAAATNGLTDGVVDSLEEVLALLARN